MSILISIVSHQQGDLILKLLNDIQQVCDHKNLYVVITKNIPEKIHFKENDFNFMLKIIENKTPKGFGANHNNAFRFRDSNFFAVLNPDLRLIQDPFYFLSSRLSDKQLGIISPLIVNTENIIEDNARRLPTPFKLLKRNFLFNKRNKFDYKIEDFFLFPDWIAGIFMMFSSTVFLRMNGFDERYFLYFEDVDLCSRLRLAGYKVVLDPSVKVIHEARRKSHKNIQYFIWHVLSGLRFFSSPIFFECLMKRSNIFGNKEL